MSCPSCGAPLPDDVPGVVVAVCTYCGTALTWDAGAVQDSGKKSRMPQGFTRLYTGATGTLDGKRFTVLGRIRYSFGAGFWDEWYLDLESDGSGEPVRMWLTEDDHELALEETRARMPLELGAEVQPGRRIQLGKRAYIIEEVGEAECMGIEGQLPEEILPGETYRYADGSSPDGRYTVGLEWDGDWPAVFTGRWVDHDELELDDEGMAW